MTIPPDPIGRIPRPPRLIKAMASGGHADPELDLLHDAAVRGTVARFDATAAEIIAGHR